MTMNYKGQEPDLFVIPTYVPGYGKWINKIRLVVDGDAGSEANLAIAGMGLADRTMWLAHRTLDIRAGGTYDTQNITFNTGTWTFKDPHNLWDLRLVNGSWPLLDPARPWDRHSLRLHTTTRDVADTSDGSANLPDAWITSEVGFRAIQTRSTQSSSRYHEIELEMTVPDKSTLTGVQVLTRGSTGASSFPITYAKYRLARYKDDGAYEYISAEVNDAHNDGNYESTTLATTVLSSGTHEIDKSYTYVLIVKHPYKSGSPSASMLVRDVKYTGTSSALNL